MSEPFSAILIATVALLAGALARLYFLRAKALRRLAADCDCSALPFFEPILKKACELIDAKREIILRTEEELNSLQDQYNLLTENMAAAIIWRDSKGRITYCSPFTEVLTGYPAQEILAEKSDFFLKIVHQDDLEAYGRALKVTSVGEPFQFRYRFFHKSGILMWAETRTVPIMAEDGNVDSSLSITIDVTGAVRYQKQVEEKNRDLQDFTYMVSHDLKAPIATIKGMLAVVNESRSENQAQSSEQLPLEHIMRATKRLELLVSSVLEYARVSNQEFAQGPVSIEAVLKDVLDDFAKELSASSAEVSVAGEMPVVMGDRVRIYQVFSNLVGNAIKYRNPNRALKITIEALPLSNPRYSTVNVKDNGIGIASEHQASVFRPFYRISGEKSDGLGIGLACVKKVVDKCGGWISLESTPDTGSCFSITLRKAPARQLD
ncbi:MAG: PAS domain-containing sensor histidine kinase [Deltaproteobacteria bacterium]|nr:PAS domain-containing sensor histidine kinase [Deltaproteobacteria bacterium]